MAVVDREQSVPRNRLSETH